MANLMELFCITLVQVHYFINTSEIIIIISTIVNLLKFYKQIETENRLKVP